MGRLFNYDGGIMQTLSRFFDCICLSFLWFLCCIPIFTIGASSAALYYAYNKVIRQKRSYIVKEFFHGFKINFKQSTVVWLITIAFYLLIFFDLAFLRELSESIPFASFIHTILLVTLFVLTAWVTYVFPYMARFTNRTKVIMKNSALIMIANFPWSILLLVLFIIAILLFLLIPIFGIFGSVLYVALANLILERVFRKYMSEEDLESEREIEMYSKR